MAQRILHSAGINNVSIELTGGHLSDHYDPHSKTLRLSPDIYHGHSLASLGIAAHEVGHALQDRQHYAPLMIRNAVVPMASFGSNMSWLLLMLGAVINSFQLILLGIALFSAVVFFQLVNLPVEYNASSRARQILASGGFIARDEMQEVSNVLNAAAMTYLAATVTAILTLLYYLFRFGLLGQRNE